jgi:hypothetical protein
MATQVPPDRAPKTGPEVGAGWPAAQPRAGAGNRGEGGGESGGEELRASDILHETDARRLAGESIGRRVGARAFDRARVAGCSPRLFERYDLADPWNPSKTDLPVGLGPAARKLSERRPVAPHARVKGDEPAPASPDRSPHWVGKVTEAPHDASPPGRSGRSAPRPARAPSGQAGPASSTPRSGEAAALQPVDRAARTSAGRFRLKATPVRPRDFEVRDIADTQIEAHAAPTPGLDGSPDTRSVPRAKRPAKDATTPARMKPASMMNLDDLFAAAGAQGRDRRVGLESEQPKSRKDQKKGKG